MVKITDNTLTITNHTRSFTKGGVSRVATHNNTIAEGEGFLSKDLGEYPGWVPNPDSALLQMVSEVYEEMSGGEAQTEAIHAGLECGVVGKKLKGVDIVSIGPEIEDPHSPGEKVNIKSTSQCTDLLFRVLAKLAE